MMRKSNQDLKERDTELVDQLGQGAVDNVFEVSQNETTNVVLL